MIEDCFVKVNDDAIKLYESNTVVRDCVIWQLENDPETTDNIVFKVDEANTTKTQIPK